MERMMPEDEHYVLHREHIDRYEYILPLLYGRVLDVACGTGYGSAHVSISDKIATVESFDIDPNAIELAKEKYDLSKVKYAIGDITALDLTNGAIDCAISFETLEHLTNPELAVSEINRVIGQDGFWVGSVPSNEFDDRCERVYGKNPYHITRFTQDSLEAVLRLKFRYVEIYSNEILFCSTFQCLNGFQPDAKSVDLSGLKLDEVMGSLLFMATNSKSHHDEFRAKCTRVHRISSMVEYDELRVSPFREALTRTEELMTEKDRLIRNCEKKIDDRDRWIAANEILVKDRDEALRSTTALVEDRDEALRSTTALVVEKDNLISAYQQQLNETLERVLARDKRLIEIESTFAWRLVQFNLILKKKLGEVLNRYT